MRDEVIRVLAGRHAVAPEDERAFGSWNMEDEFQKIADLFVGIRFIVWFVGIFTLIAGIIGVSNIMLIAVRERTREIGIKRTVGATPLSVISQVLMEALLLTSIPGYASLVCGVAVLEGVGRLIHILKIDAQMFQDPSIDFYRRPAGPGCPDHRRNPGGFDACIPGGSRDACRGTSI